MEPSSIGVTPNSSPVTAAIIATAEGTATPAQQRLAADVTSALRDAAPEMLAVLSDVVGPLATVMELPYSELNPVQEWLRDQAAEADQARSSPPFGDMSAVYDMLVASTNHSGPSLRLSAGANIVALDAQHRRYLIPYITKDVLDAIRAAEDDSAARRASRRKGGVKHRWSIERTGLVPTPKKMDSIMPLEPNGSYLMLYQHPIDILDREPFVAAAVELCSTLPFSDILIWDKSPEGSTLWSVLGSFGHRAGTDMEFADEHAAAVKRLRDAILAGHEAHS